MSEICTSPFYGGDRYYDIDLVKELDMDIWKASVALQESAEEEWVRKTNNKMVLCYFYTHPEFNSYTD